MGENNVLNDAEFVDVKYNKAQQICSQRQMARRFKTNCGDMERAGFRVMSCFH